MLWMLQTKKMTAHKRTHEQYLSCSSQLEISCPKISCENKISNLTFSTWLDLSDLIWHVPKYPYHVLTGQGKSWFDMSYPTWLDLSWPALSWLELSRLELSRLGLFRLELPWLELSRLCFSTFPNFICPDFTCPDFTPSALIRSGLTSPDLTCPALTCPDFTCQDLNCPDLIHPDFTCPDSRNPSHSLQLRSCILVHSKDWLLSTIVKTQRHST